jgi:methionyl-tRNA formyltransferase
MAMARECIEIDSSGVVGRWVGSAPKNVVSQQNQKHGFSRQNKFKIGYFGDGEWAHGAFELFADDPIIQIQFVVVRNDHPDPVLINLAEKKHIPWVTNENINSDVFLDWMSVQQSDLFVSMSFNQIFKKRTFDMPPYGTVNCHAGMLPFYRGRNILNWALINDEKEFGITVHFVDEGVDTGDIIDQKKFPITDFDNYATLLDKAIKECPQILYGAVKKIISDNAERISQKDIHPVGMYCSQRKVGDENIDWNQNAREIFNFIRAICKPGPMARCMHEDDEVCINKAAIVHGAPEFKGIPGAVLYTSKKGIFVKTKDSMIEILEYIKKKGRKLRAGDRLFSKTGY